MNFCPAGIFPAGHFSILRFVEKNINELPDSITSGYITIESYVYLQMKKTDAARKTLKEEKALAQWFDSSPGYAANNIRFAKVDAATGYDDYGVTAMDGVERTVLEQGNPAFTALWEEIKQEED